MRNNRITTTRHSGDTAPAITEYASSTRWQEQLALKSDSRNFPLMMLKQIADVSFPTRWAHFRLLGFEALVTNKKTGKDNLESALALVLGDIHCFPPMVRIHSQCITGEVLHSLRCDCHDQLHLALRRIAEGGAGVLIYEQQEGRGIGLMEKLRAYELQDRGFDTVEANLQLGHPVDSRDYTLAVEILRFLKIHSLRLMSNNPEKVRALTASGIQIAQRIQADVQDNPHCTRYLATKREKLGHLTPSPAHSFRPAESSDGASLLTQACAEMASPRAEVRAEFRGGPW
jgi:GTP cyclohydrolase II